MFKVLLIILTLKHADSVHGEMSGYVLGGEYTKISNHPHSVFLDVHSKISCICGGSILTQDIVLSAAHCFDDYRGRSKDLVFIRFGGTALTQTTKLRMRYYRLHDYYNEVTLYGDIALLRTPRIKLGNYVKRVAIMVYPPASNSAFVSGWGTIDQDDSLPKGIKQARQTLQSRLLCGKYLSLPAGTFCAGRINGGEGYPGSGDSGAALIIKDYIQIGIVSFREEHSYLVVYTNISYHYTWIKNNAAGTYCARP